MRFPAKGRGSERTAHRDGSACSTLWEFSRLLLKYIAYLKITIKITFTKCFKKCMKILGMVTHGDIL